MGQSRYELVITWPDAVEPTAEELATHLDYLQWAAGSFNWGLRVERDGQDVYSMREQVSPMLDQPVLALGEHRLELVSPWLTMRD